MVIVGVTIGICELQSTSFVVILPDKLSPILYSNLRVIDNILLVVFKHGAVGYNQCNKPEVIEMLNTIISEQIKKEVTVEVQMLEDNQNFADVYQEVISRINMDIEEEDF